MSLKVVHIVTVPQSLSVFLGGQVSFMKRKGLAVEAISSPGKRLDEFAESEDIDVHAVRMQRQISPIRDLFALVALCRVLWRIRPEIVHAHTPKAGLLGMIAAWMTRVPVRIYHIRGLPMQTLTGWRFGVVRFCEKFACRLSHRVLSVSHSVRSIAIEEGLCRPEKIAVLNSGSGNGVDSKVRFNPTNLDIAIEHEVREKHGLADDSLIIGFVGRMARDKGIVELVRAWEILREEFPSLHLLIIGGHDSRDPIDQEVVEKLKADQRILLVGQTKEIHKYYSAFDVCLLPTYREGLPNVLLEAAAMECPVVATNVTGCVDAVVDGQTGKLVASRDHEALAQATREYLHSPTLRMQHGRAARRRVQQEFSQETLWLRLLQEYHDLAARQGVGVKGSEANADFDQELKAA